MDELSLLLDLHLAGQRQGPGGDGETDLAIKLAGLTGGRDYAMADIGCGTGASSLHIARALDGTVTAVDFLPAFLERVDVDAQALGLSDRVRTLQASMDALPFAAQSLDVIWSEGAIYNMGFTAGIQAWRDFLRPGGVLAVSELTWLTAERPAEETEIALYKRYKDLVSYGFYVARRT